MPPRLPTAYYSTSSKSSSSSSSTAAVRLFRVLQRHCRTQLPANRMLLLQPPLDPRQAGASRVTNHVPVATTRYSLFQWLLRNNQYYNNNNNNNNRPLFDESFQEWMEERVSETPDEKEEDAAAAVVDSVIWTNAATIQDAIRFGFRNSSARGGVEEEGTSSGGRRLDWAIRAYQFLVEQSILQETSSVQEVAGVRIAATSCFVGISRVQNNEKKYRFAYRIRIENIWANEFELMGRSWIIQETNDDAGENRPSMLGSTRSRDPTIRVHDPKGGAVGQFPVLQKGQAFEYMSGCELGSPTGIMKGSFHFRDTGSDCLFEVPVQPFQLVTK